MLVLVTLWTRTRSLRQRRRNKEFDDEFSLGSSIFIRLTDTNTFFFLSSHTSHKYLRTSIVLPQNVLYYTDTGCVWLQIAIFVRTHWCLPYTVSDNTSMVGHHEVWGKQRLSVFQVCYLIVCKLRKNTLINNYNIVNTYNTHSVNSLFL